jgi:hypothetical protein
MYSNPQRRIVRFDSDLRLPREEAIYTKDDVWYKTTDQKNVQ